MQYAGDRRGHVGQGRMRREIIQRRIWAIALSPDELYHESRKYMANIKKHATAAKKYRLNCLRITAARSTVVVWVDFEPADSITSSNVDWKMSVWAYKQKYVAGNIELIYEHE